jgi:hypothetical protein
MTTAVAPGMSIVRHGILRATVLGASVSFIDTTAVNVALPAIGRDLDAGLTGSVPRWRWRRWGLPHMTASRETRMVPQCSCAQHWHLGVQS